MKKFLSFLLIIAILLGVVATGGLYFFYLKNNVKKKANLYIPHNATFDDVLDSLQYHGILKNYSTFKFIAGQKKYPQKIKSGKYSLKPGMSNRQIINMLISHNQTPVDVYIPSTRTVEKMAKIIAPNFEFTDKELIDLLHNNDTLKKLGFNRQTIAAMFLPDKYQFYWDYTAHDFLMRMYKEYKAFWTDERKNKASQIGLTPIEVSILASIVQSEQMSHPDERPRIAGLYINRLKKGIPLQADPTVIFAIGDFSRKRIYQSDTKINSPYNTYLHAGLPPGPILIPDKKSIDAVLNYEKNDYLYMCAKEDFSGYHNFSKTLLQHNLYAKKYQQALNKAGIK